MMASEVDGKLMKAVKALREKYPEFDIELTPVGTIFLEYDDYRKTNVFLRKGVKTRQEADKVLTNWRKGIKRVSQIKHLPSFCSYLKSRMGTRILKSALICRRQGRETGYSLCVDPNSGKAIDTGLNVGSKSKTFSPRCPPNTLRITTHTHPRVCDIETLKFSGQDIISSINAKDPVMCVTNLTGYTKCVFVPKEGTEPGNELLHLARRALEYEKRIGYGDVNVDYAKYRDELGASNGLLDKNGCVFSFSKKVKRT